MKYLYPNDEDKFNVSEFIGEEHLALANGFIPVSDEEYAGLKKHVLCWSNETLVENYDATRDDGSEVGIIVGKYSNERIKRIVDEFLSANVKVLAVDSDDLEERDYSRVKFIVQASEQDKEIVDKYNSAIRYFNIPEQTALAGDKWFAYRIAANAGISQPKTQQSRDGMKFPLVVKTRRGSLGSGVYLVNNFAELLKVENRLRSEEIIYQEFIENSRGRDMRVICIGGKAAAWYKRTNDDDFRANIAQGGRGENCELPEKFREVAEKAAEAMRLDFCGIDILFGANGPLLCEVNPNPMVGGIEVTTGNNVINELVKYVKGEMQL